MMDCIMLAVLAGCIGSIILLAVLAGCIGSIILLIGWCQKQVDKSE